MNSIFRHWLHACHLHPRAALRAMSRLPRYWRDARRFSAAGVSSEWHFAANRPCLDDAEDSGGSASGHYFHQDLFVAQCIFTRCPRRHIDVGSRVDGFVAHVAAFRSIECFDLRPLASNASNMTFHRGNLLEPASLPANACDSLSCLHVIEHVGLGRYGDELQPDGWRIALRTLAGILDTDGVLYLSVPVGRQRIEFNAHRVFAPETIVRTSTDLGLEFKRFAWVDDGGYFHPPVEGGARIPEGARGLEYGCGIFELRKAR